MKTVCFVFVVAFAMENCCASAQRYNVSACKDGVLQLNCRFGLIQIDDVILADSRCSGRSCCPRQGDCRGSPSATYRNQVHTACNGQQSCSTNPEIRNIGCSIYSPNNDYTNITFSCTALSSFSDSTRQHSTEEASTLDPTHPQKPGEVKSGSEQGKSASQVQTEQEDNNYGYLDRVTALVSVIVGGVVITAIVISIAIVLALKKRRIVKVEEEHYDMPNYSCNANNGDENVRNSNIYQ